MLDILNDALTFDVVVNNKFWFIFGIPVIIFHITYGWRKSDLNKPFDEAVCRSTVALVLCWWFCEYPGSMVFVVGITLLLMTLSSLTNRLKLWITFRKDRRTHDKLRSGVIVTEINQVIPDITDLYFDEEGLVKSEHNIRNIVSDEAWNEVMSGTRDGCHDGGHWWHVAQLGTLIATIENRDPIVPIIFGLYHDCRRESDGHDPDHGPRAALLFQGHYNKGWVKVTHDQMVAIKQAIYWHTSSNYIEHGDVQTCLDADRLTLPRVGIQTHTDFLHTDTAKALAVTLYGMHYGVCTCG